MKIKTITFGRENPSVTLDRVYSELTSLLAEFIGEGKPTHEKASDARFLMFEMSDNILEHDRDCSKTEITIKISDNHEVEIFLKKHDGNNFDQLAEGNQCEKIRDAARRMRITPLGVALGSSSPTIHRTQKIKFNLLGDKENYELQD